MSGERILVVDDGKENREFVIDYILKPGGFEAIQARDGMEGMELARRMTPDLILLDLQMPRMNGIQVLEALRHENLNIPVILMTFHGSEDIAVEVFRLGVRDYVKKPYTPEEMMAAIDASLTETRLRHEKEALTNRLLAANRELHNRVRELNTLYGIGKQVTALVNPPQLMARVIEAATVVTNAEQGSLWLIENDKIMLRAVRRHGEAHGRPAAEISADRVVAHAVQSRKPVSISSAELVRIRERNPNAPSALLVVPMLVGDRVMGALGVEILSNDAQNFTDHDTALLSALGDYAAIAIENSHNFAALEDVKERENMRIRGAFERYVAPSVVDRVLRDTGEMRIGGNRREISILFADIRGYTTFSEQADPERVVELLNEYFTLVTDIIFAREGTLDKFLGDAVMAFFNAPEDQTDHTYRAVDAALALQAAVIELNARRGHDALQFSIGVNVGEAVVGNIGTPRAMNYTAIGDAVNLAKRLQEHAEPGQIIVDQSVITRLGDLVQARLLGEIQVKGRKEAAIIYELNSLT